MDFEDDEVGSHRDFEQMVTDLRRTFVSWLRRTDRQLHQERESLVKQRKELEDERSKMQQKLNEERLQQEERLRDERRKVDFEATQAYQQIAVERDDMRKKMLEDRTKFEKDRQEKLKDLELERQKFRGEFESFEIERQRIVDHNAAAETVCDLNVGGVAFETTKETLLQQAGSFLEALTSGRHHVARDRQGRIFLDRDAELFRLILNFLRNPSTPPVPRDHAESEALVKESKFYGIHFYPFPLVFSLGGHDGYEHLATMEVLDIANQCWRNCRAMAMERTYFGSAVLDGRLFAYCGQNLDYKALCDMEIYDCLRDSWIDGAKLLSPRRSCCSCSCENRIFALGGFDGSNLLNSVEAYDPRMKNWMQLANLATPRSSAACDVVKDRGGFSKIMISGGTSGSRLKTVETYDLRMNRWVSVECDMIEERSNHVLVTCLNQIYACGGSDNSQQIHYSCESLENFDSDECPVQRWSFRKPCTTKRFDLAACLVSDSIVVGGGQNSEVLNSTEFYRPELDEWQEGPQMLQRRYGHAFLLCHN